MAVAGWMAYGVDIGLFYTFHRPAWQTWQGAVSMTLFLGSAYLVLMFIANVCFLIGPLTESMVAPADVDAYRVKAWRMGLWGSVALPLSVPLVNSSPS